MRTQSEIVLRDRLYSHYGRDFQDAGDLFDAAAARRWSKAYRWYFRNWLPKRSDARIVELGCGNGCMLYFLKALGYTNISGVDLSEDQVALARQVIANVVHANALDWMDRTQQQFDLVVSLDLIEHLSREEVLRFLDSCFRIMSPNGRLILQTPNADSPFGMQVRYGDITHEWAFNVNQLTRLMKRAGFSDISAREQGPIPLGYSFASTSRWIVWQAIRSALQLWNLAETGRTLPVLTRVFLIQAVRAN